MKNKKLLLVSQFLFAYLLPSKILYSSAAHKTNDTKKPLQKKTIAKKPLQIRAVGWLLKEPFFLIGFTRQDEIYDFSRGLYLGGI